MNGDTEVGRRLADAVLRATGASAATLMICVQGGDSSDGAQLGLATPEFQQLTIGPALFRRTRATMFGGTPSRYELLVSASAVEAQVSTLELSSAAALFSMVNRLRFGGADFVIESWSSSVNYGEAFLYRLLLRSASAESVLSGN
jgi:hypothetical protein